MTSFDCMINALFPILKNLPHQGHCNQMRSLEVQVERFLKFFILLLIFPSQRINEFHLSTFDSGIPSRGI